MDILCQLHEHILSQILGKGAVTDPEKYVVVYFLVVQPNELFQSIAITLDSAADKQKFLH